MDCLGPSIIRSVLRSFHLPVGMGRAGSAIDTVKIRRWLAPYWQFGISCLWAWIMFKAYESHPGRHLSLTIFMSPWAYTEWQLPPCDGAPCLSPVSTPLPREMPGFSSPVPGYVTASTSPTQPTSLAWAVRREDWQPLENSTACSQFKPFKMQFCSISSISVIPCPYLFEIW